jgi:hypothetical protein
MYEIRLPQGGAAVFLDREVGLVVAVVAVVTRDVASTEDISGQLAEAKIQDICLSIHSSSCPSEVHMRATRWLVRCSGPKRRRHAPRF